MKMFEPQTSETGGLRYAGIAKMQVHPEMLLKTEDRLWKLGTACGPSIMRSVVRKCGTRGGRGYGKHDDRGKDS